MKIKTSAANLTPKNLSMSHYTTIGFGQIIPVANYEVCPKSNLTIKPSVFARTDPQKLPNLGSIRLNMHGFYVPFHLVWKHFENFIAGRKSWNSKGAQIYRKCPYTDNVNLTHLFTENTDLARQVTDVGKSDFGLCDSDNPQNSEYYAFTQKGKAVYHILSALGYKFTFVGSLSNQSGLVDDLDPEVFSLLPLMCYFKAFMDRYIPSYLQISSPINGFFEYVEELTSAEILQPIGYSRFDLMFDYVFTYYEQNYFTSAWTSPNSPLDGVVADYYPVRANSIDLQKSNNQQSASVTENITYPTAHSFSEYTETMIGNVGVPQITSTQLTLVEKFNNLVRKLGYSGSRIIEAMKALFGVTPPALEVDYTQYLGSCSTELQKSDVTSTGSDTEALGSMAGKSWFAEDGGQTFRVNCDYYGMVLILASLDTPSNFVRGLRRNLTHIEPLSFYQPDFDGTLLQAIRGSELFSQNFYLNQLIVDDLTNRNLQYGQSFGFVPRYAEYSIALDNISGDFDIGSLSANITPYILPREVVDLDDIRSSFVGGREEDTTLEDSMYGLGISGEPITPLDVINGNDSVQFNRIFKDTTGIADPFFCVFHFDTLANTPTLPLDEAHELRGRGKLEEFSQNGYYLT